MNLTPHKLEVNWSLGGLRYCIVNSLAVFSVPFLTDHRGKSLVAALPIPPVTDMTSGVKLAS